MKALDVIGAELTVGSTRANGNRRRIGLAIGVGDHDPERIAPARRARNLEEDDVVTTGEDSDPARGDERTAGGAVGSARERFGVVARIHPRQV